MITSALLTILPTLWAWYACAHVISYFRSMLLKLVAAWAVGQFVLVWITAMIANLVQPYTTQVLWKSLCGALVCIAFGSLRYWLKRDISVQRHEECSPRSHACDCAVVATCIIFSHFFFRNHLYLDDGKIFRSEVFWDFSGQFSLIQSFIVGDNFPPTNELMAGAPLAYHYFFFLWAAVFGVTGLGLIDGFSLVSVLSLSAVLIMVVGLTQHFTGKRSLGILALVLAVTSSSFRWCDLLLTLDSDSFANNFSNLKRPDSVAFTHARRFGYNGNMFNLFYFLEERQLTVGCLMMMMAAAIFPFLHKLRHKEAALIGALFGLCVQWHFYALISIVAASVILLARNLSCRQFLLFTCCLGLTAFLQVIALRSAIDSPFFLPSFSKVPYWDFRFATVPELYPLSFLNMLRYWIFALGVKIILIPMGIVLLNHRSPRLMWIMLAFVVPTFILTNSVRLSPLSIYENHKWIRPLLLIADCCTAVAIAWLCRHKVHSARLLGWICIPLAMLSGILEGYGYFRPGPAILFAQYPSSISKQIVDQAPLHARFYGNNPIDVLLAGRKMYVTQKNALRGNIRMDHNFLRDSQQISKINALTHAPNLSNFCASVKNEPLDYYEVSLTGLNQIPYFIK